MNPSSLFILSDHLERLSKDGDPLEVLAATVDFAYFRGWLVEGLGYSNGPKRGPPSVRSGVDVQGADLAAARQAFAQHNPGREAQHNLSDARMEFVIHGQLSWMRFLGFGLGAPTPDENTIRHFRNRLTETGTLKRVMKPFDWQLKKKGYTPMSGQTVDASLVSAPIQRNTEDEKAGIKRVNPQRRSGQMNRTRPGKRTRTRASRCSATVSGVARRLSERNREHTSASTGASASSGKRR